MPPTTSVLSRYSTWPPCSAGICRACSARPRTGTSSTTNPGHLTTITARCSAATNDSTIRSCIRGRYLLWACTCSCRSSASGRSVTATVAGNPAMRACARAPICSAFACSRSASSSAPRACFLRWSPPVIAIPWSPSSGQSSRWVCRPQRAASDPACPGCGLRSAPRRTSSRSSRARTVASPK